MKKIFSFQIPLELYDYLKHISKEKYTDMTKYLISLIAKDKLENEAKKS